MSEINPTSAANSGATAPTADACRCHETPEVTEEFPGCQCHLDAAKNLAGILMPGPLAGPVVGEAREVGAGRRWSAPEPVSRDAVPKEPCCCGRLGGWLAGTMLTVFLLGGTAFLVFALLPAVTMAFALVLVGLAPLILWGLFVLATLDLEPTTAERESAAPPQEASPARPRRLFQAR